MGKFKEVTFHSNIYIQLAWKHQQLGFWTFDVVKLSGTLEQRRASNSSVSDGTREIRTFMSNA